MPDGERKGVPEHRSSVLKGSLLPILGIVFINAQILCRGTNALSLLKENAIMFFKALKLSGDKLAWSCYASWHDHVIPVFIVCKMLEHDSHAQDHTRFRVNS